MTWEYVATMKGQKVAVTYVQNGRMQTVIGIVEDVDEVKITLSPYWKHGRQWMGMTIPFPIQELDRQDHLVSVSNLVEDF